MTGPSPSPVSIKREKLILFRVFTIAVLGFLAVASAEVMLGWHQSYINRSDRPEPGLIQYDPNLGWRLTPGWTGKHRNYDFTASYSINDTGFRAAPPPPAQLKKARQAVIIGDSFTFGLGVNDDETFTHRLNLSPNLDIAFINCAVPGFSTDQEMLLVEERLFDLHPSEIFLMVYLGNDLLDNPRPYPLQMSSGKPYYALTSEGLVLHHSPVPLERAAHASPRESLAEAVLGPGRRSMKERLEQKSELIRMLSQSLLPESSHRSEFPERFAPAVRLFSSLIERLARDCQQRQVKLSIAMLAGSSYFEKPDSVSAQYQDYFREQVLACGEERKLRVIDLPRLMREHPRYRREKWFYPHDGHLTASGHKVVAEILATQLSAPQR